MRSVDWAEVVCKDLEGSGPRGRSVTQNDTDYKRTHPVTQDCKSQGGPGPLQLTALHPDKILDSRSWQALGGGRSVLSGTCQDKAGPGAVLFPFS